MTINLNAVSDQDLLDELKRRTENERISIGIKVAERFGVTKQYVSQLTATNELKNTRIFNSRYILLEDAEIVFGPEKER